MAKVAFIGLGVMGYPMARHLAQRGGHDVTVYNRTSAKAAKWVAEHGGRHAATPKAAARQRDAIEAFNSANSDVRSALTDNLRRYERHEPCRVPWRADPI